MPPVPPFYDSEVEVERYGSIAFSYNSVLQSNQSWTFHVMASESPGASYLNMYLGTVLVHVDRRFVYSIGVLYYRRPVESNRRIPVLGREPTVGSPGFPVWRTEVRRARVRSFRAGNIQLYLIHARAARAASDRPRRAVRADALMPGAEAFHPFVLEQPV
jgi:hypothetical protein